MISLRRTPAGGLAATARQPSFLVGQDKAGHWLALRYAAAESSRRPGAVRLTRRRISLPI
jgi:hypothetical protein